MTGFAVEPQPDTVRTGSILALGLGVPLLLMGGCAATFALYDGRSQLYPADFVDGTDWQRAMMPGAHDATDEICDADFPCVQAVDSETLILLKFRTKEEAAHVASHYGDTHLSAWLVVRYNPGGLTAAERTDFEFGIDCTNTFVGAGGQDC